MMFRIGILFLYLTGASIHAADEPVGRTFLRYMFGDQPVDVSRICIPTDDLWMIPGARDSQAIANLGKIPDQELTNGVVQGAVAGTSRMLSYFFEIKDGKVDTSFSLDPVYRMHKRLAQYFVQASISQNQRTLERISTDASKVKFDGPKAPPAEMGVYEDILSGFPVVRSSDPRKDAQTKSVTYRIPLGTNALSLKMTKAGGTWKVDTSEGVTVPTWTFFK